MSKVTVPHGGTSHVVTTYIEFLCPGILFPESSTREVEERNPERHAREAPEEVFAFRYYDLATSIVDQGGKRVTLKSGKLSKTGRYYIDAVKMDTADVEYRLGDEGRILLSSMRGNGWEFVLRCRTGNYQPLLDGDEIILTGARCDGNLT